MGGKKSKDHFWEPNYNNTKFMESASRGPTVSPVSPPAIAVFLEGKLGVLYDTLRWHMMQEI